MSQPAGSFHLDIERVDGYEFRVRFDKPEIADLIVDEPPPLGENRGPNPARLLAAAIGSCLSASLQFCLSRANVAVSDLKTEVDVELVRNERRRLRIGRVAVRLHPEVEDASKLASCTEMYEDFCVVTQSVRDGIDVEVEVDIAEGLPTRATAMGVA